MSILAHQTLIAAENKAPKKEEKPQAKPPEFDKLDLPVLLKRAQSGEAAAEFELGSRYNYGRGMPKNTQEALQWLRKAGDHGYTPAQRLLAVKLYSGFDGTPDFEESMKWTTRLAQHGDPSAQLALANMLSNGEGAPRDLVTAYMWYDIAAVSAENAIKNPPKPTAGIANEDAGKAPADVMDLASTARDKTAALLTAEEQNKAQKQATDWWLAKQGIKSTDSPKINKAKAKKKTAKNPSASAKKEKQTPAKTETTKTKPTNANTGKSATDSKKSEAPKNTQSKDTKPSKGTKTTNEKPSNKAKSKTE
jgi:hypothetical protein